MGREIGVVLAATGVLALTQVGIAAYFYKRTMKRNKAKVERTMKMAGTDWDQYIPMIQKRSPTFCRYYQTALVQALSVAAKASAPLSGCRITLLQLFRSAKSGNYLF